MRKENSAPAELEDPRARAPAPDRARRALVGLAIGVVSGVLCHAFLARPGFSSDFFFVWSGARTLLDGGNPYATNPAGALNPGDGPVLYPLPALLLVAPLARLPLAVAGGVFFGLSAGALAYLLTRHGYARLPLFMSAPFLVALSLGQWSPLLAAAALEPNLAFAAAAKPNLGVAAWAHRPTVRAIVIGGGAVLASLLVLPSWPLDWLRNVSGRPEKFVPVLTLLGPVLLLAVLRWRTREARLFLAMACVPQALFFYDQLLLWLIPRTLRQSLLLSLASFALMFAWYRGLSAGDYYVREAIPYALALYVPVLITLLWATRRASANHPEPTASPGSRERAPEGGT